MGTTLEDSHHGDKKNSVLYLMILKWDVLQKWVLTKHHKFTNIFILTMVVTSVYSNTMTLVVSWLTEAEVERLVRVAGLWYTGLRAVTVARILSGTTVVLWWHGQRPLPRLGFGTVLSSWPDSLVGGAQNGLDREAWNGGRRALASAVLRIIHSRLITVQKCSKNDQMSTQQYVPLHIESVFLSNLKMVC